LPNLQLSLACSDNPRTRPIIDGIVKPDGIDLHITVVHPSEMFWRQLHFEEFDVSEMSLSSLTMTVANGGRSWVGIPIFTSRRFFHTGILVRTDRGIDKPEDLKGKVVGVPEYQQTAALWTRAALQHVYNVRAADMKWWMERNPEMSHGGATGFKPPAELEFHYIPPEQTIGTMLVDGQLDAALHYIAATNLVDRSGTADPTKDPNIRTLFPDERAEGISYYQKTGFYPINHGVVVKRELYEREPWVVLNLFNAFSKAKNLVNDRTRELASMYVETGLLTGSMKTDLYPYGVRSNKEILSAMVGFSHEQGLTQRVVGLEEIFAAQTMDL
jgi:4,5-dihydroxyphthalate decarboxylase